LTKIEYSMYYNCTYVLSSTCLYAIFPHGKVFGPPCIFPEGDRRWGPIFSNYMAPLVIITTNQLVANFVEVHQYFTRSRSMTMNYTTWIMQYTIELDNYS